MAERYAEQYARMMRWYRRFEALNRGRVHDSPSDNYVDEIYAFFMNCYHLKDWIETSTPVQEKVVEEYINNTKSLRLCADICNSLKHLRLTRNRSREKPEFGAKKIALNLGQGAPTISFNYEVKTVSGTIDAFQLATDCVKAWDAFFLTHGLIKIQEDMPAVSRE